MGRYRQCLNPAAAKGSHLKMVAKILKFFNDNHWYIIAGLMIALSVFWTYGCVSTTTSLLYPEQKVCRSELQNELNYLVGLAKAREEDLDRQDEVKQALLDAANIISQTGSINPSGLINLAAMIGAIGFGLNRNQKLKTVIAEKKTNGT